MSGVGGSSGEEAVRGQLAPGWTVRILTLSSLCPSLGSSDSDGLGRLPIVVMVIVVPQFQSHRDWLYFDS